MNENCAIPPDVPRVALVEPNDADAYWFQLLLTEENISAEVTRYSTGISALRDWTDRGQCACDVIVVSEVLPMLDVDEFLNSVRTLNPQVRIVLVGEAVRVRGPEAQEVDRYVKPLSA